MRSLVLAWGLAFAVLAPAAAQAQPTFSKQFSPDNIAVGSATTLTFTIQNTSPTNPATQLAFTDVLPAGVVIAASGLVGNTCSGTVSAPSGGSTITHSDGQLGTSATCTIQVDVTANAAGSFVNTSGDLTSSFGNSGPATDTLSADAGRPGFSKAFLPAAVALGDPVRLQFTVDNSAGAGNVFNLTFIDNLPTGLRLASPPNFSHTCSAFNFVGTAGATSFTVTSGFLTAGQTCTLGVDVATESVGSLVNRTGDLTGTTGNSGKAVAVLEVSVTPLSISKSFINDPIAPGGTGQIRYRIQNANRGSAASVVSFTDDLDAALSGLQAAGPLPATPCGPGSSLSGTSVLTLSGGALAEGASCEFVVSFSVPAGAAPGSYPSTTSTVSGVVGGSPQTGNAATDQLAIQPVPSLTITDLSPGHANGDTFTLEFVLTNTSASDAASGVSFQFPFSDLGGATLVSPVPVTNFCGAGSFLGISSGSLSLSNVSLAGGANCTFQLDFQLPLSGGTNTYTAASTALSAIVGGNTLSGGGASVSIDVLGAPQLVHEFIGPVQAGGVATLRYRLSLDENSPASATAGTFTHDLDAVLTGLVATGLPLVDVCGTGSSITGTSLLTATGITLAASDSCSFDVSVQVPAGVLGGSYPSTTSTLSADIAGTPVTGAASSATLQVTSLRLTQSFIDSPVLAGNAITLRYQIDNLSASAINGISFSHGLSAALSGLNASGLPTTPCGAGSSITGTTTLVFAGGQLAPGGNCSFDVTVNVPGGAAPGSYGTVTSAVSASEGGTPTSAPAATSTLEVGQLSLLMSFTNDPVAPSDSVTLEYVLSNPTASGTTVSAIGFTHDLGATLTGLVATGLPLADPCGAGSSLSGTGVLTLTGASLAPGATCTIPVTLSVPSGVGGTFVSSTSSLTVSGVPSAPAAFDALLVDPVEFSLQMLTAAAPGGSATAQFTLTNQSADARADLAFSLDLGAAVAGMVATGLPQPDVCGAGSTLSGTGILTLAGGSLGAGATCSFTVTLAVPIATAEASYPLTTSEVSVSGLRVAGPASASLQVLTAGFSKAFAPAITVVGGTSTLSFLIDNSASAFALGGLAFTDNLPAGMQVASPANASTTCTGGTLTAAPGSASISYAGGSVAAGATCSVQVNVRAVASGTLLNTSGALSTAIGTMGTASATLAVSMPPAFTKSFAPATIFPAGVSTLSFVIDNGASAVALSGLAFSDNFPAGMTVASTPNALSTCGGTLTAIAGSASITFSGGSVGAGASCTVSLDVAAGAAGSYVNTSSALTTGFDPSPAATAMLTVIAPPAFSKAFTPASIATEQSSTLIFTIDNSASGLAVSALDFIDNLPAGLVVAATPNASTTCTGGTLTAVAGSGSVSYSGGALAAAATCTVQVDVRPTASGSLVNTSGNLTSSAGNSGPATATLVVSDAPLLFSKTILPGQQLAGGLLNVSYTIQNPSASVAVSALSFTDDFAAVVPGAVAEGLPQADICGTGSSLSGTGIVTLGSGSLAPASQCSFQVQIRLPSAAAVGSYSSVSSALTGSAGAGNAAGAPASAAFEIVGLPTFTKDFAPDAVLRGASLTLTYTLQNSNAATFTGLAFQDDLGSVLPGLAATGTPLSNVCGAGSSLSGSGVLNLAGASLGPNAQCSFSVTLQVPAGAPSGLYTSTSAALGGSLGGTSATGGSAASTFRVVGLPQFTKTMPASVSPGQTFTLRFTLTQPAGNGAVTDLAFTDDLDAFMPGALAQGLPRSGVCGAGSQLTGTSVVALQGGSLADGGSCSFEVTVRAPATIALGSYTNVTSPLSGTIGGTPLVGGAGNTASSSLQVTPPGPTMIPTADWRGLLALVLVLGLTGVWVRRRA